MQGDYYFYTALAASDPQSGKLNLDRTYGMPYKDFVTGPATAFTNGTFAMDYVTGPGHVS